MIKQSEINKLVIFVAILAAVLSFFAIVLWASNSLERSDERVFEANINKVVEVRVSIDNEIWAYGTGCFISRDGQILTNKHMVYREKDQKIYDYIQVRLPTRTVFVDAVLEAMDTENDLATIKITKKDCEYYKLSKKIVVGQEIYTIGNPSGFGLSYTKGNISSDVRNVTYAEKTVRALQTSFVINEGNSGGPVFNAVGELIGIVSFRIKDVSGDVISGVSFVVPSEIIEAFLISLEAQAEDDTSNTDTSNE